MAAWVALLARAASAHALYARVQARCGQQQLRQATPEALVRTVQITLDEALPADGDTSVRALDTARSGFERESPRAAVHRVRISR